MPRIAPGGAMIVVVGLRRALPEGGNEADVGSEPPDTRRIRLGRDFS
jgi:hypothetical protein